MKIKAICFDLGDTLVCFENQLSWANNYKNALEKGFNSINKKPTENEYIMLSKKLGVQTDEMIYIGNKEKDIIGANNARIISILINRTDEEINYGKKYQFKSLRDMWHFIKKTYNINNT